MELRGRPPGHGPRATLISSLIMSFYALYNYLFCLGSQATCSRGSWPGALPQLLLFKHGINLLINPIKILGCF